MSTFCSIPMRTAAVAASMCWDLRRRVHGDPAPRCALARADRDGLRSRHRALLWQAPAAGRSNHCRRHSPAMLEQLGARPEPSSSARWPCTTCRTPARCSGPCSPTWTRRTGRARRPRPRGRQLPPAQHRGRLPPRLRSRRARRAARRRGPRRGRDRLRDRARGLALPGVVGHRDQARAALISGHRPASTYPPQHEPLLGYQGPASIGPAVMGFCMLLLFIHPSLCNDPTP